MRHFWKKKPSKVTFKTHHKHKPTTEEAKKVAGGTPTEETFGQTERPGQD